MSILIRTLAAGSALLLSSAAFTQSTNEVLGASYSLPVSIDAAPGQILNLMVAGVGAGLTQRMAASALPLPYALAGISVQLLQTGSAQSVAVPMLAVRPVSTCLSGAPGAPAPCGRYTVVTVQVPFEMVVPCQPSVQVCTALFTAPPQLVVSENGVAGGAVEINPLPDRIHVANLCDLDTAAVGPCTSTPLVTHGDGSLVTANNPARMGEVVVIYALGLGATTPAAQTGAAATTPAVAKDVYGVVWDYQVNAPPSRGVIAPVATCAQGVSCAFPPVFAGLTVGTVGLYQVNFVVPVWANAFPCGGGVNSNLTLSIEGITSYDGAGICVGTAVVDPPSGAAR